MNKKIVTQIKDRILNGGQINIEEAELMILNAETKQISDAANEIRKHFSGNLFDMCSITNAKSGKCSEDCKWCSQSAYHKTEVETYNLIDTQEAVSNSLSNHKQGVKRFSLVTSGRTLTDKSLDNMIEIFDEVKQSSDISLCASMGLLNKSQLSKLKETGIEHYHCNLETAPSFFSELCTTHTIEDKIKTIKDAQNLGIKICSGGIIGMGETPAQRVELAFALAELKIDSIPINILNSIEGTKLESRELISDDEVLRAIAVFRFINPKAFIRFAGGRSQISIETQKKALNGGINSALVGDYLTTLGTKVKEDKQMFASAGFDIKL